MALGQDKAVPTSSAVTSRAAASLDPRRRPAGQDEARAAPYTRGRLGFVAIGHSRGARRAAAPVGVVPAGVAFPRAEAAATSTTGGRQADGPRAPGTAPRHEAGVARDGRGEQVRVDVGDGGGRSGAPSSGRGRSRAGPGVEEPCEHIGGAGSGLSGGLGEDVRDGPASLVLGLLVLLLMMMMDDDG